MGIKVKPTPKVALHPRAPIYLRRLKELVGQVPIDIRDNEDVYPLYVEIAPEVGALVIVPEIVPKEVSKLLRLVDDFAAEYERGIIILQGYPAKFLETDPVLTGTLLYLYLTRETGIIPTESIYDSALCLRSLAKRIQIEDKLPSLGRVKDRHKTLYDAQLFLLKGLINCGSKKAKVLANKFDGVEHILNALRVDDKSIADHHGFGPEFVAKNKRLLEESISQS